MYNKKLLMIAYYYPPLADVGSLRALCFSRYLSEFGWEPYVISVRNPDKHWCILGNDKPPATVRTFYTSSLFNLTWITGKLNGLLARALKLIGITLNKVPLLELLWIPDQFIGWVPLTFFKGIKLIREHDIDAIYVTCKPFSPAVVGALLKVVMRKRLVLEFRDPISPLLYTSFDAYVSKIPTVVLKNKLEKWVLRLADKIILVTEETKELYTSFYPSLDLNCKASVIYNGFDETLFAEEVSPFDEFTIVYSGNFYEDMIAPEPFFRAMREVLSDNSEFKGNINVLFVGEFGLWLEKMIDRYGLDGVVKRTGRVSRKKSIEYIYRASLLLIRIVPKMISTKLYEGLAAGVPIMALIEEGEVLQIIRKYSAAPYFIVKPDDARGIARAIRDAYDEWKNGRLSHMKNKSYYEAFSKKNLTGKFVSVLESACDDAKSMSVSESRGQIAK